MSNILLLVSDLHACGHVRAEIIVRELMARYPNVHIVAKSDLFFSDLIRTNMIVLQRGCNPNVYPAILDAAGRGIKIVYDADDDLFNIPPEFDKPYQFFSEPTTRATMIKMLAVSDAITVSTYQLALAYRKLIPDTPIFVVENCVDCDTWNAALACASDKKGDTVTIGWTASASHRLDWPVVSDAIKTIMAKHKNVKLFFIGWIDQNLIEMPEFKDRITCLPWIDITQLPIVMTNFDIGICPLIENVFNLSKSGLKWMQNGVLGIPSICTALPPYDMVRHDVDGLLVKSNKTEEWVAMLDLLITDEERRKRIGAEVRRRVNCDYDVGKAARNWLNVFEQILKG